MSDSQLTIQINAETAGAVSGITDLEARMSSLEQVYLRNSAATAGLTTATTQHTAAQAANTIETRVATEASTGLGGAMDALAAHYRIVAAGANVLGFETAGAAAKVAGFTEVIQGLEAACLPLLIALVALQAAFSSFNFLKDAVSDAENLQKSMAELGETIDGLGGNWAASEAGVKAWADTTSEASGITKDQLIPALQKLVMAGMDVHDAQKVGYMDALLSVETGKDLTTTTNALTQAFEGHYLRLVRMDGALAPIIQHYAILKTSTGEWQAIVTSLNGVVDKSIEKNDTLALAQAKLGVKMEEVKEVVGEKLLPILTDLSYWFIGAIPHLEEFAIAFGEAFQSIALRAQGVYEPLAAIGTAMYDLQNAPWKIPGDIGDSVKAFQEGAVKIAAADALIDKAKGDFGKASGGNWEAEGRKSGADAAARGRDNYLNGLLDNGNPNLSTAPPKGGSGQGKTVGFADEIQPSTPYDAIAASQKDLNAQITAMDDREKELKTNIGNATTELQKQSLTTVYDAQVTADLAAKKDLLAHAMGNEVALNQQLGVQLTAATAAAKSATSAYNTFGDSAANDGSIKAQNHLALLKQTMDDANASVTAINGKIKENSANFNENSKAIEANTIAIIANTSETAKLALAKSIALQKVTDAWTAFYAKSEADMVRDLELDRMTNAQKFVYYKQLVDSTAVTDEASLQLRKSYLISELDASKAADKEMADAYKKYIDDATKQTSTFIDDIVVKHTTLKDELKTIYDDILKQYIDMISKMIVQSKGFQSVFPFTGTGSGSSGLLSGISSLGGSSANQSSYTDGALNVHVQNVGPSALTGLTGNSAGVSPSSVTAILNSFGVVGATSDGVGGSAIAGSGMDVFGNNISTHPSTLTTALQGAGLGGALAQLISGNSTFGAIGGSLGSLAGGSISSLLGLTGGAAAGPVGSILGSLAGGLIGSMFGPHETAAQQPDLNDPTWGQSVTNWLGGPTTEGSTTYQPGAQYATGNGGTSQMSDVANWVKQTSSNLSGLTPDQLSIYNQMLALMGGNPNSGTAGLGVSEFQGQANFSSGASMTVPAFENLVSQFTNIVGAGSTSIPTFSVGRPYPNASQSTLTNSGAISSAGVSTTPTVNVTVQGNVVGSNGIAELAQTISQELYKAQNGLSPQSSSNGMYARAAGGGY